jgi:hypothetical protein
MRYTGVGCRWKSAWKVELLIKKIRDKSDGSRNKKVLYIYIYIIKVSVRHSIIVFGKQKERIAT